MYLTLRLRSSIAGFVLLGYSGSWAKPLIVQAALMRCLFT
jgi:hypothetical protein